MNIKHENTVRALRDELPIVISIWCRFNFHLWTIWCEPFQRKGDVTIHRQTRHCVHCNLTQEKTL